MEINGLEFIFNFKQTYSIECQHNFLKELQETVYGSVIYKSPTIEYLFF